MIRPDNAEWSHYIGSLREFGGDDKVDRNKRDSNTHQDSLGGAWTGLHGR